jgi:hypothetical protein
MLPCAALLMSGPAFLFSAGAIVSDLRKGNSLFDELGGEKV